MMETSYTAARDAAFEAAGLSVELADGVLIVVWCGIPFKYSAPTFVEIPFPGIEQPIEARRVSRDLAQVKIAGLTYDVTPRPTLRSFRVVD
jgi:hypothetical protein